MDPWAFSLFGLPIAWYALIITGGMMVASLYMFRHLKQFGLDADSVLDVMLFGMIGAIVGARLYYVVFTWDYFRDNTGEILNLRMGGLAFYGGVIGGVLVGLLVCKWRRVKMLPMLDLAGIGFLIGQGIGRWGNFVNVEAYGRETHPDFLFGMSSNQFPPDTGLVHPCFLYESVWSFVGVFVLHFLFVRGNRRKYDGQIALMYLVWNGSGRAVIEGLRTDSLYLFDTVRISQLLAVCMVLIGVGMLLYLRRRYQHPLASGYPPLYVDTDESGLILELGALRKQDPAAYRQKRQELDQLQAENKQKQRDARAAAQKGNEPPKSTETASAVTTSNDDAAPNIEDDTHKSPTKPSEEGAEGALQEEQADESK